MQVELTGAPEPWRDKGMLRQSTPFMSTLLLAGFLASRIVIPVALTQAAQGEEKPGAVPAVVSSPVPFGSTASAISRDLRSPHATMMYKRLWGIEDMQVRATASGAVIRFSYRVVDATKAQVLNNKKASPYLIVQKTGVKLEVPTTEKVGQLRQTATPENGREYWMVFTNVNHVVKAGDRVDIVIGTFHANGLVVESPLTTLPAQKP